MPQINEVIEEVPGLYQVVPLRPFRRTPGVFFDILPETVVSQATGVDRVVHEYGAVSPGPAGEVPRPWYMHPFQKDHLLVLHGKRTVELFSVAHGAVETFETTSAWVKKNGVLLYDGPAILAWPRHVFHRIKSCDQDGSVSLNFAFRDEKYNERTNFNIYNLDIASGTYTVLREGFQDQI